MNTAAEDFAQKLSEAWSGLPNEEALAVLRVPRAKGLYRTDDCPAGADRVSDLLTETLGDTQAEVLVGINTVNDKVYLIQLFKGSHGTMGYSFYLSEGGWREVFWLATGQASFVQEFAAYPRVSFYGTIPSESLQDFSSTALDAGYDVDCGVGEWVDAAEILRSIIVSSGGTLLQGE